MMIADINLNVTTMQRRLHRQLLQSRSLRRRHGPSRFETGQATPPRSGPVRFGGPERRQPLPAYLALVVYTKVASVATRAASTAGSLLPVPP